MMRSWIMTMTAAMAILPTLNVAAQQGQDVGEVLATLDKPVSVTIDDAPITEAVEAIAKQTGVAIQLSDSALDCLPHGAATRLQLTARQVPLREALDAILTPMALRWRVAGAGLRLEATDPLKRMNRRPTFAEVAILAVMADKPLETGNPFLQQLRELTGRSELALFWHAGDTASRARALARADSRLPSTGLAYMDMICHGQGWTWYLNGDELVVLTKRQQAIRQLRRVVSVRYEDQPILTVLADLARKADLKLTMEPGVLTTLPDEMRQGFTLLMAEADIQQALEAISGATGLIFEPGDLTLHVRCDATSQPAATPSKRTRIPFVVMMPMPEGPMSEYRVFFRPDELPEALVEKILQHKQEVLAELSKTYGVAVVPYPPDADDQETDSTTQPTTQASQPTVD